MLVEILEVYLRCVRQNGPTILGEVSPRDPSVSGACETFYETPIFEAIHEPRRSTGAEDHGLSEFVDGKVLTRCPRYPEQGLVQDNGQTGLGT